MTIQITLHANEFTKEGTIKGLTFNNGKYDSLKIVRFGNGRVYFMALSKEIGGKVGTFAKQMQLVDGNVIISFGKNDKLVIGTYVDTEATVEAPEVEEVTEEKNQLKTIQDIEEVTADTPEEVWEALKEGKKVLMSWNELDAFDNYAKTFDVPDRHLYWNINVNSFGKHINDLDEKRCTINIKDYAEQIRIYKLDKEREIRIQKELQETEVNEEVVTTNEIVESKNNKLKVNKQIETILVRGYMGKVEEREGKRIEHSEYDIYLVKSGKHWTVYEKQTGKSISGSMSTKNEAMNKLQEFLTNHYDKFKEAMENAIDKDGYISDYKIGSWIKSA